MSEDLQMATELLGWCVTRYGLGEGGGGGGGGGVGLVLVLVCFILFV